MKSSSDTAVAIEGAKTIFQEQLTRIHFRTDRLFARLMLFQWAGALLMALWLSPTTWTGTVSHIHIHVWTAIFLGGAISLFPVYLACRQPGLPFTRHAIAAAQMAMSAVLIHISGGRIETHFHVFGSLAFLAFYRDWRVLLTASIVVYIDHFIRGLYWPQSVYGVISASPWRALEHAWWVVFEVGFLCVAIKQSLGDMWQAAERHMRLEMTKRNVENEVRERTAELKQVNSQLEDFCHSLAHDLRTPLRTMKEFSEILMVDHGPQLEGEAKVLLRSIRNSSEHMDRLIYGLMEYNRLQNVEMVLKPVDLSTIPGQAVSMLSAEIQRTNAEVTWQENMPFVRGNDVTLLQILLNLISNALKFQAPDATPKIYLRAETQGNLVRLWVEDNGIGIAPHHHDRIFGMFERLHERTKYPGTGVGLALVRKGIERMGGKVGLESTEGTGARFWIELPFSAATRQETAAPSGTQSLRPAPQLGYYPTTSAIESPLQQ